MRKHVHKMRIARMMEREPADNGDKAAAVRSGKQMFGSGWACRPVLMVQDSPAIAIAGFIFPGTALYVFESIETLGKEIPCLTLAGSSSTLLSVSYACSALRDCT